MLKQLQLIAFVALLGVAATSFGHGGGLDKYGCHHNRQQGGYHCHQGQYAGQSFASQSEILPKPSPQTEAKDFVSEQTVIPDYETARDDYFWPILYKDGGETLYCGKEFTSRAGLTVEHVYAAQWMATAAGCINRSECPNTTFHHAEADLHNLWPAIGRINSSRSDTSFWEIPGEDHRRFTKICPDYERTSGEDAAVEPRDDVKGDIARSILYMVIVYDFPHWGMGPMLLEWHEADPPDAEECRRNDAIGELQGTRNPFIGAC